MIKLNIIKILKYSFFYHYMHKIIDTFFEIFLKN